MDIDVERNTKKKMPFVMEIPRERALCSNVFGLKDSWEIAKYPFDMARFESNLGDTKI